MNKDLHQEIEAYLGGDMSPEAILIFEKQMEIDVALRNEVALYSGLNHHLAGKYSDLKAPENAFTQEIKRFLDSDAANNIKTTLNLAKQHYHKQPSFFTRHKHKILSSAAALIVLLVAVNIGLQTPNNRIDDLYSKYYSTKDLPSLVKRNDANNSLNMGLLAFQEKKYKKAVNFFNKYQTETVSLDTLFFLYKGISQLELNENEAAIHAFNIVTNSSLIDRSKGLWFEALAYLKLNNKAKAVQVLKTITENSNNFKYPTAYKLLESME